MLSEKKYNELKKDSDLSFHIQNLKEAFQMDDAERKALIGEFKLDINNNLDYWIDLCEKLKSEQIFQDALVVNGENLDRFFDDLKSVKEITKELFPDRVLARSLLTTCIARIFTRLRDLGLKIGARRVDFVIQLYLEEDFQSLKTISSEYLDGKSPEELSLRDRLRKLDKRAPDLNFLYKG